VVVLNTMTQGGKREDGDGHGAGAAQGGMKDVEIKDMEDDAGEAVQDGTKDEEAELWHGQHELDHTSKDRRPNAL
jgi:hypothetical protein